MRLESIISCETRGSITKVEHFAMARDAGRDDDERGREQRMRDEARPSAGLVRGYGQAHSG